MRSGDYGITFVAYYVPLCLCPVPVYRAGESITHTGLQRHHIII